MTVSLWTEASRDLEADNAALELTAAKVACAPLWPFLALAKSAGEFEHRLALTTDTISESVEPHLFEPVLASLRADFQLVAAADGDGDADDQGGSSDGDADDAGSGKPWEKSAGLEFFDASLGRWVSATHGRLPGEWHDTNQPFQGSDHLPGEYLSGEEKPFHPGEDGMYGSWPYAEPGRGKSVEDYDPDQHDHAIHSTNGLQYFNASLGRWVALDDDATRGKGNPYYFTGGPEAGPETGETDQFPSFPAGPDPVDPLNQMFPMQPSPWTVPPGGEWKENPMRFSPPSNGRSGSRHPFGERTAARVLRTERCEDCGHPAEYVETKDGDRFWSHGGPYGQQADADHVPWPPSGRTAASHCPGHPEGHSKDASGKCVNCHSLGTASPGERDDAELQKRPQKGSEGSMYSHAAGNPGYFAGGAEGIAGDQQQGFAQAPSEDPEDEWVDSYGAVPPQQSSGSTGTQASRRHATESSPPPAQDTLDGIQFSSPQESERWNRAQHGEQPGDRDIHAIGRNTFYDPHDRGVRMVALGPSDPFAQSNNPYSAPTNPTSTPAPAPPPSMTPGGDGAEAMPPMTPASTPPRQMPGGGAASGGMGGAPAGGQGDPNDPGPVQTTSRRVLAEDMRGRRPDQYSTEIPDEYDSNTWEGGMNARPRQNAQQRGINTPQQAESPIPSNSSSNNQQGNEEEGERRAASLIASHFLRELTGASR